MGTDQQGKVLKGMLELTQSVSASKGHITHIAFMGFLLRMSAFMISKFGVVPEPLATVPARERIDCKS